jgi:hypothetical protein
MCRTRSTRASSSPITVDITQPAYGFNVLPGSVRRIFATVTGGTTNALQWTVTAGGELVATSGPWVDVTAPPVGSKCSIKGSDPFTINSAPRSSRSQRARRRVKALRFDHRKCVQACRRRPRDSFLHDLVFGTEGRHVQAFVWGSVNRNVTWAITSMPQGGDGVLAIPRTKTRSFLCDRRRPVHVDGHQYGGRIEIEHSYRLCHRARDALSG